MKKWKDRLFWLHICGALLGLFFVTGCDQADMPVQQEVPEEVQVSDGVIVAMGDSLTAGLGVSVSQAYPAQLEKLLADAGLRYEVINSGVSGETSSGALSRVNWVLKLYPDIVILETGANDGLRGIDPQIIKDNIIQIIKTFLDHDVVVVLAGMQMVTNLGPEYLRSFNSIYHDISSQYPVIFYPFFLKDVATEEQLNQDDGIHPNAKGYEIIAANLMPFVKKAIDKYSARKQETNNHQ